MFIARKLQRRLQALKTLINWFNMSFFLKSYRQNLTENRKIKFSELGLKHDYFLKGNKVRNFSLLSILGFSAVGCNATSDEQCYGGLGIILGSLCANQNNISSSPSITLSKISSSQPYV